MATPSFVSGAAVGHGQEEAAYSASTAAAPGRVQPRDTPRSRPRVLHLPRGERWR